MLSSYPEIGIKLHTREEANDGIKSVKSRAYERHTREWVLEVALVLPITRSAEICRHSQVYISATNELPIFKKQTLKIFIPNSLLVLFKILSGYNYNLDNSGVQKSISIRKESFVRIENNLPF